MHSGSCALRVQTMSSSNTNGVDSKAPGGQTAMESADRMDPAAALGGAYEGISQRLSLPCEKILTSIAAENRDGGNTNILVLPKETFGGQFLIGGPNGTAAGARPFKKTGTKPFDKKWSVHLERIDNPS